jgi:hypothetical protein
MQNILLNRQLTASATNLFKAASNAAVNYPKLKKVVIMKQIPRYDFLNSNPPGMKAALSGLFNETLQQLLSQSALKSRIIVGNHNLDCSGGVQQSRYRSLQSNKYDGVHMYGPSGEKAYTASVLNILRSAQLVIVDPPRYYDEYDHQVCEQARHQAKASNKKRRPFQYKKNRPNMPNMAHNNQETSSKYRVPTHNRFAQLGEFFPKN